MRPIFQNKFGEHEGNCLQACLASILEIDLYVVPDFGEQSDWYEKFSNWMIRSFDLRPLDISVSQMAKWGWKPNGYHIINGKSLRGEFYHSVVGLDGEMVFDPHPSGQGLRTEETWTLFVCSVRNIHDHYFRHVHTTSFEPNSLP